MGVKRQPEPCKVVSMMTWKCSIFALVLVNIGANVVEGQAWRIFKRLNDIEERLDVLEDHEHEEGHGAEGNENVNTGGTVTYDEIVGENHDDDGLDKVSGIFTAPEAGAYTVSASGRCVAASGEHGVIDMLKNGVDIANEFVAAKTSTDALEWSCSGYRHVDLAKGQTLSLEFTQEAGTPSIKDFYFCIHA